jgi:ammonium transporter, Amt family
MSAFPPAAPAAMQPMSDTVVALTLVFLLLCPLAIAGVALVNVGLSRSRSAAQVLLGNLVLIAVSAIVFLFAGASFAGTLGGPQISLHLAGKTWSVVGLGPFLLHGLGGANPQAQLALVFEFLAVAMSVLLPWGSGADRLRLAGGCAVAAVLAGIVFPVAAHWIWNGGWLAQLGMNFPATGTGSAGFLDAGGAGTTHLLGGISALAVVWVTGPRRGKFPREGLSTAMPGHSAVYVLFGCLVAFVGWLAWNAAGAVLWLHAPLAALPGTVINTLLSASGALIATLSVTRFRFGKPDASLCANGWLAGLVTSSACAAVVSPAASLFIGGVAGVITPLLVELLELAGSVDDPSGAITVHGAAGFWGLLAAGIFSTAQGQLIAQLVGIASLLGLLLPLVYFLLVLVNRLVPFRVDPDGERLGMDLHELGGGAYPEFVIHRDESYR